MGLWGEGTSRRCNRQCLALHVEDWESKRSPATRPDSFVYQTKLGLSSVVGCYGLLRVHLQPQDHALRDAYRTRALGFVVVRVNVERGVAISVAVYSQAIDSGCISETARNIAQQFWATWGDAMHGSADFGEETGIVDVVTIPLEVA